MNESPLPDPTNVHEAKAELDQLQAEFDDLKKLVAHAETRNQEINLRAAWLLGFMKANDQELDKATAATEAEVD